MKVRTRILLITLSLILVTGAVSTVVSQIVTKNVVRKQLLHKLETVAESRVDEIRAFLQAEKGAVEQLSEDKVIHRFLSASRGGQVYQRKFQEVKTVSKYREEVGRHLYDLFLLDKEGMTVASTTENDVGKDRSQEDSFLGGKEGVHITDPYFSEGRRARCLAFSAPVLDYGTGDLLGVVVSRLSMEALDEITTDRSGLGQTGETYLVNREGYLITSSRFLDHAFLRERVNAEHLRARLRLMARVGTELYGGQAISYRNYMGSKVLGVCKGISPVNSHLLVEVSEKEALAPVATLGQVMPSVLWVLSVVAIIVSFLMSATVTKPISRLLRGTEEVVSGNLDYRVGAESEDEIGQLSRSFDNMTASLKRFREQVEEYQKTLEEKVEARTRQLAAANRGLRQEVEERKRAEVVIKRRLELEKTISFVSSRLLATVDLDDAIMASLRDIGRFSGARRALLCLFASDRTTVDITHEWCAEGVQPEIDNFKRVSITLYRWWMRKLENGETIHLEDLSKMPSEAGGERELLEKRGVRSLVTFPVSIRGVLAGFATLVNVLETQEWRAEGSAILGVFADVLGSALERKRAEDELKSMSIRDHLTGLLNRRGFVALVEEQLKLADRHRRDSLLLFADVDNLKRINDTLGHREGDRALVEIANVLDEVFRESDIKARVGGDEFAVFAVEAYPDSAQVITSRLQQSLEARNSEREHPCKCSLSIGIVPYDHQYPCSLDELLTRADTLMYRQKEEKKQKLSPRHVPDERPGLQAAEPPFWPEPDAPQSVVIPSREPRGSRAPRTLCR
jgi:diguanylate cyclase (GGDEF)-like protein